MQRETSYAKMALIPILGVELPLPAGVDATSLIPAAFIILAASLVKGTTGFGFALVATPLLLLLWEPLVMVPVLIPAGMAADILIVGQNRQRLEWGRVAPMAAAGILGIPLGTAILLIVPSDVLKIGVAVVVLVSATILMTGATVNISRERIASSVAGFMGGVLLTSTTISGPPVTLFLINQRWAKDTFRTSLALFFLTLQAFAIVSLAIGGILTFETLVMSVALWPSVLLGYALAVRVLPHIPQEAFLRIATVVVMATGLLALVNAVR